MTEIRSTLIKLVIIFFLTVTFTISISQFSNSQSVDNQEIRGVWLTNIDSDVLFTANQTKKAIATLDKLNFNSLYPTVWNWGHTLYPSQVAENATGIKVDPTEALKNRDVLQEIISESHKKKIAVIPWFEFGFMAPADSSLAKKHPNG